MTKFEKNVSSIVCHYGERQVVAQTVDSQVAIALTKAELERQEKK